jgi:Rap guanine nucleotide exchange factor 4
MDAPANKIILMALDKAGLKGELNKHRFVLCEVKSSGEKSIYKENDVSILTSMSINGSLFVTPYEHLDALTPLPEQEGPVKGTWQLLEMFGSKELAYILTLYDWELFNAVHPV